METNIYWKKEKANLVIPIEKNQDTQLVGQKKNWWIA